MMLKYELRESLANLVSCWAKYVRLTEPKALEMSSEAMKASGWRLRRSFKNQGIWEMPFGFLIAYWCSRFLFGDLMDSSMDLEINLVMASWMLIGRIADGFFWRAIHRQSRSCGMRGEVGSVRAELIMWVIEEEMPNLRRSLYQLGLQPERPAAETVRVRRIAF